MNDTTWLAEDGRLLKDLRTSAGLDIHEFARAASISVAQLRQLEDGGNELFYSQSIKFQMGRKLLRKLGADIVRQPEEATPETPSLFAFDSNPNPGPSLEEVLSAAPTPVLPEPQVASVPRNKRWVPLLAGLGVLIFAGVFGSQLLSPPVQERAIAAQAPTPAPVPAPTSTPNVVSTAEAIAPTNAVKATPLPENSSLVSAANTATTPPAATAANTTGCRWGAGPGNSFMPRGMEKPSSYIHLVANESANLCIQDRNQKVTQVQLQAGEKLTVRGTAPWRIQSEQWSGVSVFFQGYRMPVPASATLVTLNPRTEPLAEPTAQSN